MDKTKIIKHLDKGGQINGNGGQCISKVSENKYFMDCYTEGCCDMYMNKAEMIEYISDDFEINRS